MDSKTCNAISKKLDALEKCIHGLDREMPMSDEEHGLLVWKAYKNIEAIRSLVTKSVLPLSKAEE